MQKYPADPSFDFAPWIQPMRGGGGWNPMTADVFVDSVNGSDANPGTYASPKQTLDGAAAVLSGTKSMAIFRGSTVVGRFVVPYTGFKCGVVGSGAPPIWDGAQLISGGWTNVGGGTPNVWTRSLTGDSLGQGSTPNSALYENGSLLPFRASVAAVEAAAAPGWYTSSARTANTYTAYIYSTTDPNTNGKIYEQAYYYQGWVDDSGTLGDRPAYLYGPIQFKRFRGHYNAVAGGLGTQQRMWIRWGSTHHIVTEGDTTDVLLTDFDPSYLQSPLAEYRNIGAGLSRTATRFHIVGDGSGQQAGLFSHGGASVWGGMTADQCVISGVSDGIQWGSSLTNTITNCATINCRTGAGAVSGAVAVIRRHQHSGAATGGGRMGVMATGVDPAARNVLVEDSVFYFPAGSQYGIGLNPGIATLRRCVIYAIGDSFAGWFANDGCTVRLENCIVVLLGVGCRQGTSSGGLGLTFFGSNNIYVGCTFWQFGSGAYNGFTNGLPAWQALTGQDAGSIYDATGAGLFSGTVANGDFRLALTGLGATARAMGVGPATYWDHNTRSIKSGPPPANPTPPMTTADQVLWNNDPTAYNWYP